jgi:hypothetical protein
MTRYQMRKKIIASVIPALVSPASCLQCFTQCLSQFRVTDNRRIYQRISVKESRGQPKNGALKQAIKK